jgi:hypothetical protein
MKNIILKNGLIGGLIIAFTMVSSAYVCYNDPKGFEPNFALGFGGMLLSFVFVYLGIEKYKKSISDGTITFYKAFQIGTLITLIISTIYVGVWLIVYYNFFPDFIDKYAQSEIAHAKPSELAEVTTKMESYKEMYKNPFSVIAITYMEIVPLGVIITLISSLILKKK